MKPNRNLATPKRLKRKPVWLWAVFVLIFYYDFTFCSGRGKYSLTRRKFRGGGLTWAFTFSVRTPFNSLSLRHMTSGSSEKEEGSAWTKQSPEECTFHFPAWYAHCGQCVPWKGTMALVGELPTPFLWMLNIFLQITCFVSLVVFGYVMYIQLYF